YASAVSALVALAAGRPHEALVLVDATRSAAGTTYLDVILSLVAAGLAHAHGSDTNTSTAALDEAITLADGAGDVVMQAVTRLAAAETCHLLGRPDTDHVRRAAVARLDGLVLGTDGWATAIGLASRGGASKERIPVAP